VKEVKETIQLANLTIAQEVFNWRRACLTLVQFATFGVALGAGIASTKADLGVVGQPLTMAVCAAVARGGPRVIEKIAKFCPQSLGPLWEPVRKQIPYCPHSLTTALAEYRSSEDVAPSIDQKLLRQGSLPISDDQLLQINRGTALVANAIARSGSDTLGFRGVLQSTLALKGAFHL
jgi:hypothetical protein